jgi:[ribosomal protein S5]-alanine N-acetyltransferase
MKQTPILTTKRLVLRPFIRTDVDAVYDWCSSFETTRYLFWYPHRDKSVTERVLNQWIDKKRNYFWAIDQGGVALGEIEVIKDLPGNGFECGYILSEPFWGKGIMTEAFARVLSFLFLDAGYEYSYEETDAKNLPSRRLLESLGFQLTGTQEHVYVGKKNEYVDKAIFRLDKPDYLETIGNILKTD